MEIIKDIRGFDKNVKLVLLATLITNVGNGMSTIAISKLLYDRTGSALAFGGILFLQYTISLGFQFIAGAAVDRYNPKYISVLCDSLRGALLVIAGIGICFFDKAIIMFSVVVIIVNMINPFFNASNFKIVPLLLSEKKEILIKVNGIFSTLFQSGQLLGTCIAAPILFLLGAEYAIVLDGITFILSAILVAHIKNVAFSVYDDNEHLSFTSFMNRWKELFGIIKEDKSILVHIFMSTSDYFAVNVFNIILVPMVTLWYKNRTYFISLFDGGFAIGAIASVVLVYRLYNRIGMKINSYICPLIQALLFAMMIVSRNFILTVVITFTIGIFNAYSVAIYQSTLQDRIDDEIKGRIGGLRSFVINLTAIISVPFISFLVDYSIKAGIIAAVIILSVYSFAAMALNTVSFFGHNFMTSNND